MASTSVTMQVRRISPAITIIDIHGDIDGQAETPLMDAYSSGTSPTTQAVILNFEGLQYMNSMGIGLVVTLLIRINRQKQRLLAYGLSEHYRHIFELTRLNEAIGIYDSEALAVAAVQGG